MSVRSHIAASQTALASLSGNDIAVIELMAGRLAEAFKRGNYLFIIGNGGSAADAMHIAAELVVRYVRERKALPAMALTADTSAITANTNDYGFESVFSRQLEAFARPGDVLWAISTSGSSKNVIAALQTARKIGMETFGFTGQQLSKMNATTELCQLCLSVGPTTAIAQQLHMVAAHAICEHVEQAAFSDGKS